jgi:hypothetical protein
MAVYAEPAAPRTAAVARAVGGAIERLAAGLAAAGIDYPPAEHAAWRLG